MYLTKAKYLLLFVTFPDKKKKLGYVLKQKLFIIIQNSSEQARLLFKVKPTLIFNSSGNISAI